MEVVIDIDEKIYRHVVSTQFCIPCLRNGKSLLEQILKAIRTGTPLPKGHGDLIDSSNLLCINDYDGENERIYVTYYEIENAKPINKADNRKDSIK